MVPSAGHTSLMSRTAAADAAAEGAGALLAPDADAALLLVLTRSNCPLLMRFGLVRLFNRMISATLVSCSRVTLLRVSPDCTRYYPGPTLVEIGRASCRERGCQYV